MSLAFIRAVPTAYGAMMLLFAKNHRITRNAIGTPWSAAIFNMAATAFLNLMCVLALLEIAFKWPFLQAFVSLPTPLLVIVLATIPIGNIFFFSSVTRGDAEMYKRAREIADRTPHTVVYWYSLVSLVSSLALMWVAGTRF
jgi:hypothetical protein